MQIKGIIDENFTDYKDPSMFIAFSKCSFKCEKEAKCKICQNSSLVSSPTLEIEPSFLIERYLSNPITKAVVLGGLEPFDSLYDLKSFLNCMRRQYNCLDTVVIYTGYTEKEILNAELEGCDVKSIILRSLILTEILVEKNLIVKYGRFIPNQNKHFDEILGVELSSPNQYAKEYNYDKNKTKQ